MMDRYVTASQWAVTQWKKGEQIQRKDCVIEETPVALVYSGIAYAVMLATPADLNEFALGFSLTEGILASYSDMYACKVIETDNGIQIDMDIASERLQSLKERQRNLTGRVGYGLCGTNSLSQAVKRPLPVTHRHLAFSAETLHAGFDEMERMQVLKQMTGATHAAAWLDEKGHVSLVREDIGRHNALDKLIGALMIRHMDCEKGAVLVTSRASYEMVQKCASVGIGMLAAVSAPTALAIRVANQANITLVGFVRQNSHTMYTPSHCLT